MNTEKWNEICFLLSENIKKEISENEFEQKVIQALGVLGWKEFLGDFDIRPSFKIGAANSITPDFIIKSENKEKLFVIEIKQPHLPISSGFQQQLFSYMRQLKLDYGLLIGQSIQIFYDGHLAKQDDPILIENIKFERNNEKGEKFVELFSKNNFSFDALTEFTIKSLEKINRKEDFKLLSKRILSEEFNKNVLNLIKQEFIREYDGELIDSVLSNVEIEIKSKEVINTKQDIKPSNAITDKNNNQNKRRTKGKLSGLNQTDFIRKLIREGFSREEIIKALAEEFEIPENALKENIRWAKKRMYEYEKGGKKPYGPMGINDPKL